ncbi:MAG TPA: UDP-GlcNAc--UDP-phosphate GlcNAc-1-phosphate transferase [Niabella sp.]
MLINFFLFFAIFMVVELLYFGIAKRFEIVDKPNNRSSHEAITIRGGGIIFPIACIAILFFIPNKGHWLFAGSLLLIAVISFIDDMLNLSSRIRLLVQAIAIIVMFSVIIDTQAWYLLVLLFIMVLGIINAYNFMDGINGITALYSLVTIGSLFYVNSFLLELHSSLFFIAILAALAVFSFFNLRRKAVCFAGDVGSVSIAFIICFLLFDLIFRTDWYYWLFFLGVYGMDTCFTIVCRLIRKEKITVAHRSHFYQYLANEASWSHLSVSCLYAGGQAVINLFIINAFKTGNVEILQLVLFAILLIYIIFRVRLEGTIRLFAKY